MTCLLAGCGSSFTDGDSKPANTRVTAADFRSQMSAAGPQTEEKAPEEGLTEAPPPSGVKRKGISSVTTATAEGMLDVSVEPGEPSLTATTPTAKGAPVFVDAKVGDVNNRAIYASAFLEPMIDRLESRYAELKAANPKTALTQWRLFAKDLIRTKINAIIEDEVLRAEALNSLQPEQKAGFFTWLQSVRSELVAENRGIEAAANENLSAQNGTSLDQTMKAREQQELIKYILYSRVYSRANVSFRDIQNAFEKNYELFNPNPVAFFRMFSIPVSDQAKIDKVKSELAGGKEFDDVADEIAGSEEAAERQLNGYQFDDEYSKHDFFGPKEFNEAAHGLTPGKWAGPIAFRNSMYWIKLEHILKMSEDLYQAQLYLENLLVDNRQKYERMKYVDRLKSKATFTDIELMTNRLLHYAEERVLGIPQGKNWKPPVAPAK